MSTPADRLDPSADFSLTEQLYRDERQAEERMRLEIENLQQRDPERTRRIMSVQNQTGLPFEVADAALEDLEHRITTNTFDYDQWRKESPAWTSFAADNPYHLSVLKEDYESMKWYERWARQIELGFDATDAQVEMARMTELRIAQGGEFTPEQEAHMDKLRQLQVPHEFGAEGFAAFLVKNAKMWGPTREALYAGAERGWMGMAAGMGAALWMGQMGPQVAIPEEVVTGPALAIAGGAIGFQSGMAEQSARLEGSFAYDEYREMGLSHETALYAASAVGGVNAILESAGINLIMRTIPGAKHLQGQLATKLVGDVLTTPTVKRATAAAVVNFGTALGGEVITEGLQEGVTAVVGMAIQPEDAEHQITWDEVTSRVADAMVETIQGAFIISSLGPTMSYYSDVRKARRAKQNEVMIGALGDSAKAMKLREKLPKTAKEFAERVAGETGLKEFFINVSDWDRYWQGQKEDPGTIAERVGVDAETLREARAIDGDISITLPEYTEKIAGTSHHQSLTAYLKRSPDEMSASDAEYFRKNNPDIMKQLEDSLKEISEADTEAARERIIQDVFGQLLQADVERHAAGQSSQALGGIATIAQRAKLDPDALFNAVFGGVTRVRDDVLTNRTNVDLSLDPYLDMLREGKGPTQKQMFGPTLIDFIKSKGGLLDEGGELSAMDAAKEQRGLVRPKAGKSLDAMAELAAEAGFLPQAYTPNALLDAVRKELAGDPVRSRYGAGDPHLRELGTMLESLEEQLGMIGLDPKTMTNEEIRKWLEKMERFDQLTPEEIAETLAAMDRAGASVEEAATDFANVFGVLDVIAASADFGNVQITDTVRIRDSGETVEMTAPAQSLFDKAKERKKNAKRLMDCLSG